MIDFFISYNGADRGWAEWIAWQLEEAGYTTVLQAWDFRPGSSFVLEMQKAATEAERTIAVLSPDYLGARLPQPEWAAAFARDPMSEKGILLPVRVRECDPEGLLGPVIYIDVVELNENAARDALLTGVLRGRAKPTSPPAFPGAVSRSVPERPSFPGTVEDRGAPLSKEASLEGVALDLSHGQEGWKTTEGIRLHTKFPRSHPELHFLRIEQGTLTRRQEIESSSVLVIALPLNHVFTNEELDYVQQWVETGGGLFLLGLYLADSHHERLLENEPRGHNINGLARVFDFEFCDDLIMPIDRSSLSDCLIQSHRGGDVDLSVTKTLASGIDHSIMRGVTDVAFLSACSLGIDRLTVEYVLKSPPCKVLRATGEKDLYGRLKHAEKYDGDRQNEVPLLAAWRHGEGRIVASGTWKICTWDYGDNATLVRNILNWLSQPSGTQPA